MFFIPLRKGKKKNNPPPRFALARRTRSLAPTHRRPRRPPERRNDLRATTDYLLHVVAPPPRSMLLLFNASEKIRFWFVLEGPPSRPWLCASARTCLCVRVSEVLAKYRRPAVTVFGPWGQNRFSGSPATSAAELHPDGPGENDTRSVVHRSSILSTGTQNKPWPVSKRVDDV
jgi:hypothetical protein